MKRIVGATVLAGLIGGVVVATAGPSLATWVGDHCNNDQQADSHVRRKDARAYATVAFNEGYEWGGGCWNDNNRDDTPSAPDSSGEGPDCSGYVFKSWELQAVTGHNDFTWHDRLQNIHGPYTSSDFHSPMDSEPFFKLKDKSRNTTMYMDAFAKNGHIGIIYGDPVPSSNQDYIAEAKGDDYGVGEFVESYRFDSDYVAVRREKWTPDCYPNCQIPDRQVVVLP